MKFSYEKLYEYRWWTIEDVKKRLPHWLTEGAKIVILHQTDNKSSCERYIRRRKSMCNMHGTSVGGIRHKLNQLDKTAIEIKNEEKFSAIPVNRFKLFLEMDNIK